jgi:hypothetical protein
LNISSLSLTSLAAHARIAPAKEDTYKRILDFARERRSHGLIADEIAAAWNCDHNRTSPRICELVKSGRLVATKFTRPTRSGSRARVFVLPEFAETALADQLFALIPDAPERHRDDG